MSALPGCPKCGGSPESVDIYSSAKDGVTIARHMNCSACGFEGGRHWTRAVTRELAEQALALRAASGVREDGRWINLSAARNAVINDYALLCANPLTLTIGGGDE